MNKIQWKGFILGMVFMIFLGAGLSTAFASSSIAKNIKAYYNNYKIVVDGKLVTLKDPNGKIIEPFSFDGTTYIPIRGVSQALDKKVTWDEKTQTIYIGEKPKVTNYLSEINPPYRGTLYSLQS